MENQTKWTTKNKQVYRIASYHTSNCIKMRRVSVVKLIAVDIKRLRLWTVEYVAVFRARKIDIGHNALVTFSDIVSCNTLHFSCNANSIFATQQSKRVIWLRHILHGLFVFRVTWYRLVTTTETTSNGKEQLTFSCVHRNDLFRSKRPGRFAFLWILVKSPFGRYFQVIQVKKTLPENGLRVPSSSATKLHASMDFAKQLKQERTRG